MLIGSHVYGFDVIVVISGCELLGRVVAGLVAT